MKPGWKTTEFWVTTLATVGSLTAAVAGFVPGPWGLVAAGLSSAAYAISRGIAKKPA
jgi:hypothetical protein